MMNKSIIVSFDRLCRKFLQCNQKILRKLPTQTVFRLNIPQFYRDIRNLPLTRLTVVYWAIIKTTMSKLRSTILHKSVFREKYPKNQIQTKLCTNFQSILSFLLPKIQRFTCIFYACGNKSVKCGCLLVYSQ